jgi:hypothetical protein
VRIFRFRFLTLREPVYGFLSHDECAVNRKKFEARLKLKVGGGRFWAHMYAYNVFLKNFKVLALF